MNDFARCVIDWQRTHGRHDLPWQNTRDPYAIWLSEVMLQQTQVATVIPYYLRFMQRFPTLLALAAAPLDDVLVHWSGLGYYSRARNLHRAAQVIRDRHAGRFPDRVEEVAALPGIGRSTAAAVVVFAYGGRYPILDGNVKRVLARFCGIAGYPGDKGVVDRLWAAAARMLPGERVKAYTQGLMDLGTAVCVPRTPRCEACPVSAGCIARKDGLIESVPAPRPRKPLPHRQTVMLLLEHAGSLLLEKRPAPGIWGGLWSLPEIGAEEDIAATCAQRFGARIDHMQRMPDVRHGFTHFSLTISPQRLKVGALEPRVAEPGYQWLEIGKLKDAALPAPVKRIVGTLSAALS